jgi:DOPA 4,5-dioxygenase
MDQRPEGIYPRVVSLTKDRTVSQLHSRDIAAKTLFMSSPDQWIGSKEHVMSFFSTADQAQNQPLAEVKPLSIIQSYHAHIYFEGGEQRRIAETLRDEIAQRFSVLVGGWHDRPIGPHMRPMYQAAFAPAEFAKFVPWLMLNRHGLAVLIHPNTGYPRRDHLHDAMWLGEVLGINAGPFLVEREVHPEPEIIPNTRPTVTP